MMQRAILTRFLILGEIQDGVTSLLQPHHPLKINLILLSRSKAFHCRKNRFEILQIIKNSGEGFHPPLPLIPWLGYEFACTSEG